MADLTDGLFLRDLDHIVAGVSCHGELSSREIRRVVNKYRIGEQEDHWGTLSIERLNAALRWFVHKEGVKGQDEALRKVVDTLCLARAGLTGLASGTGTKPKGALFSAGPTGVGKTFVAKKLAKFLFGTEEAFLRFDMSEFKEEHTVSKLIGSPPGYVGYERGGMLTNGVREKPFSVILFDEVEKAHPKIMDIFLQILGEGRLTDSRGQTVFFTETVIIFTSNLGTRTADSRGMPVSEREQLDAIVGDDKCNHEKKKEAVRAHFTRAVERFFAFEISRPELLNRIGNNIVPFNYIHTLEIQRDIVNSHLRRIADTRERLFVTGVFPEEALAFARWMGEGFDLPTSQEWRSIFSVLAHEQALPHHIISFGMQHSTASVGIIGQRLLAQLRADSLLDLSLMRGGIVEWVRQDNTWVGLGAPRPELHPNLWDPLTVEVKPIRLGDHVPYFGFRLVRRGG
jgi:ATP-dependent Clp protease ATP-binding subunit ClpA